MRDVYNQQLNTLHDKMIAMGGLCQDAISLSVKTLTEDEDRAKKLEARVFAIDSEIDEQEREIERLCTRLVLKQQPVASDLRSLTSALKMVTDLERIGDQASDIAELAHFVRQSDDTCKDHLEKMADETIRMVSESVEAFVHLDLNLARAVIAYDDVVDGWFDRIKKELVQWIAKAGDEGKREGYLDTLLVAKYLERIGDHATNLAEWVEYAITGARSKDGEPFVFASEPL